MTDLSYRKQYRPGITHYIDRETGFYVEIEERGPYRGGDFFATVRHAETDQVLASGRWPWNVWLGHCGGSIDLVPGLLKRAAEVAAGKAGTA